MHIHSLDKERLSLITYVYVQYLVIFLHIHELTTQQTARTYGYVGLNVANS
jgi:hypothetical protein